MTDAPISPSPDFAQAVNPPAPQRRKASPFCLRLTFEERARLETEAGNIPLGTYIKGKLFGADAVPRSRPRRPLKDEEALGRVAGMLGRSRLSQNLNQLAHAANSGSLPVTPETESALQAACAEVALMREELLKALGLRADLGAG